MERKRRKRVEVAELGELENELHRVEHQSRFRILFRSTVYTLIVVAAAAVLVAVLFMPVLRIYGSSMTPTLSEGQIVVSLKGAEPKRGDIVGVYLGRKLLIKRVIALEHEWVNIDENGNVFVDGVELDEPYLDEKSLGECDIEFPYQVPDTSIFVMGDHRSTSVDSRSTTVGCIQVDDIVGIIVFRVWPLSQFGTINQY